MGQIVSVGEFVMIWIFSCLRFPQKFIDVHVQGKFLVDFARTIFTNIHGEFLVCYFEHLFRDVALLILALLFRLGRLD